MKDGVIYTRMSVGFYCSKLDVVQSSRTGYPLAGQLYSTVHESQHTLIEAFQTHHGYQ